MSLSVLCPELTNEKLVTIVGQPKLVDTVLRIYEDLSEKEKLALSEMRAWALSQGDPSEHAIGKLAKQSIYILYSLNTQPCFHLDNSRSG